jgi:hypothetical protein
MKPNQSNVMAAALTTTLSAARANTALNAFFAVNRPTVLRRYPAPARCGCVLCQSSSNDGFLHRQPLCISRRRQISKLSLFEGPQPDDEHEKFTRTFDFSSNAFVEEVISFLATDGIPIIRHVPPYEIRNVLEQYLDRHQQQSVGSNALDRVDKLMALSESSVFLAIGRQDARNHHLPLVNNNSSNASTIFATSNDIVKNKRLNDITSVNRPNESRMADDAAYQSHAFMLHICPTLTSDTLHKLYNMNEMHNSSLSEAVTAYAWLNSLLTDAFYNYNSERGDIERSSIVHLHQDVWNRSPAIVQSRLRSKCGLYRRRIYARQTNVRRITKSDYIPFLEDNHLWGATGAKYAYGLFMKSTNKDGKHQTDDTNIQPEQELLVAVATFSSKREVNRARNKFHSYELLRFCSKLDMTVVGGLTKLVAAFLKEVKSKHSDNDSSGIIQPGIDIVTSIDRDFGSNTWPNFERVQVMDPIPMFIGEVDGVRRHAVGVGLAPLEQAGRDCAPMSKSMILRAGLPASLLQYLALHDSANGHDEQDCHWQIVAQHGFHPVFDAGVERLMFIAEADNTSEMSIPDLWSASLPCYVKEYYSMNSGIQRMLNSIRSTR